MTRCCLRGELVRDLSTPDASFPSINRSTHRRRFRFSIPCFATTAAVVLRRSPLPQPCVPCQNWPRHKFRFSLVHLLEPAAVPHRTGVGRAPSSSSRPVSAPPSSVAPWPESFSRFLLQPDSVRASWLFSDHDCAAYLVATMPLTSIRVLTGELSSVCRRVRGHAR